jgi:hypothetical protein
MTANDDIRAAGHLAIQRSGSLTADRSRRGEISPRAGTFKISFH